MAETDEEVIETPKASKLPMIIAAVVALVIGGGAGFGGAMFVGGETAEASENAEGAEPEVEITRAVHTLGLFTVNLRGSGGGRVLRMEVQVETNSEDLPVIEENTPMLRDSVLTVVSDYSYADIEGLDGKTRLRDELLGRINTLLPAQQRVERVYFTEFVVQ